MPREIFGHVTDPPAAIGSRKWYTVLLSLAGHTLVIVPVVLVPLMATDVLPSPREITTLMIATPTLPDPPPAPRPVEPHTPQVDPNIAPIVAPEGIKPEQPFELEPLSDPRGPEGPGLIFGDSPVVTDVVPPPPPPKVTEPVRPGSGVRIPAKIRDVAPVYPTVAQIARVEGTVILEAVIDIDGSVQNVRVLRSKPLLDQAAIDAVRQWVYTPTTLNGVPVPVIMTVTVTFTLNK